MDAKELRIGNWVKFTPDNGNFIVSQLDNYNTYSKTINGLCNEDCEPIRVTEEWLVRFGFSKDSDGSYLKNDISIFIDKRFKSNLYLQTNDKVKHYDWFGFELKVEHVHQLQNLYYSLTQKELIWKKYI